MLKELIARLVEGHDLSQTEAAQAMATIMEGKATPSQIAAFLTALRMKGETSPEITGLAWMMREKAMTIPTPPGETIVDTCGTGGDSQGTFNISTTVAFVAAGAGLTVAKHGNRSISSQCGSADVLEALGINISLCPEKVGQALQELKIAFLFAPNFHPAMKYALAPRREIGIRTVFNLLGPLTNPARAAVQLLGIYRADLLSLMAEALKGLGSKAAFIVHGQDGCDEISITGKTDICQLKDGQISQWQIEPEDAGLPRTSGLAIKGGSPEKNAQIVEAVLKGEKGACRNAVLLNAAGLFMAAEKARDFKEGVEIAEEAIDSGRALKKLHQLIHFSQMVKI
ncbi:MAG: anthranilate phosphoribosyltransferase [Thermodesulfobacteriota bacterium]